MAAQLGHVMSDLICTQPYTCMCKWITCMCNHLVAHWATLSMSRHLDVAGVMRHARVRAWRACAPPTLTVSQGHRKVTKQVHRLTLAMHRTRHDSSAPRGAGTTQETGYARVAPRG